MGENAAYAIHGTTEKVEHPDMPDGLNEWVHGLLDKDVGVVECSWGVGIQVHTAGGTETVVLKTSYQAKPEVTGFVVCLFNVYEARMLQDVMAKREVAKKAWAKLREIAMDQGIALPDAFTYVIHDRE
jgi:hypothetical protein